MNIIKYFIFLLKSKNTVNIWLFTNAYHIKHIIFYTKSKKFFTLHSLLNHKYLWIYKKTVIYLMNMLNVLIFSHKINFMKNVFHLSKLLWSNYYLPILITSQNTMTYIYSNSHWIYFCMQKGAKSISLLAPFISTAVSICYFILFQARLLHQ